MNKLILFASIIISLGNTQAQTIEKPHQIKLDTAIFLGKQQFGNAFYFQKEMAYCYYDSSIYYLVAGDFQKGQINIRQYNLRTNSNSINKCDVPGDLFSKTLIGYPRKLSVTENRIIIKMYGDFIFLQRNGNDLSYIRHKKNTSIPNFILTLNDSILLYTESNMTFGQENNISYTKLHLYNYLKDSAVLTKSINDASSFSWYGIHDARVCHRNDTLFVADKWLRKIYAFNQELDLTDSFDIPAFDALNPHFRKRKNLRLVESMSEPVDNQKEFYEKYGEFINNTYHIQGFYPLNDTAFFLAYIKGRYGDAKYEIVQFDNGKLESQGLQNDNHPSDSTILTKSNIHNVLIRRTILVSDNKLILFEYHPRSYPIGKKKGEFYKETLVTSQNTENCELVLYLFEITP